MNIPIAPDLCYINFMRPYNRFVGLLTLATSLGLGAQQKLPPGTIGFDANTITGTTQKPVLATITQEDVDDFQTGLGLGDLKFHWVSKPSGETRDEKKFMKQLAKDCHEMGLGFVPHVFVVAPRPKPTGPLSPEPISLASSMIDNIGPYIIYRGDLYDILNRKEKISFADHELLHEEELVDFVRHHWQPIKTLQGLRQEELDGDRQAVILHHGKALLTGMEKGEAIEKADFYAYQAVAEKPSNETYESKQKEDGAKSDHPLTADREALVKQEIKDQKQQQPLVKRWLKFGR